jgi:DNA-binding GntR family transcriptional regulator
VTVQPDVAATRTALNKRLLSTQVYDRLKTEIASGKLKPGERLVESEIARTLDVSQAPVRDALKQLTHEGLVLQLPRRGSFVATISQDEAKRSYIVRAALEAVAAREFCEHAPDATFAGLESLIQDMFDAADRNDTAALMDADMSFHRLTWTAGGNPLLPRMFPMVESAARSFSLISNPAYFHQHEIAASHQPLLEALRERNVERAVAAHEEHVREVWQRIERGQSQ